MRLIMNTGIAKSFSQIFVTESSKIDPQPGYPCNGPGDLMYDNHQSALFTALSHSFQISQNMPLDLHRFLTRGIDFYEREGMSGQYRNCDVWIGGDKCPPHYLLKELIDNVWYPTTVRLINKCLDGDYSALEAAWISHHIFEVIHPFIDGNGRTGRLILNKVLTDCGAEPVVIFYSDRWKYYSAIQDFRDKYWNGLKFVNLEDF